MKQADLIIFMDAESHPSTVALVTDGQCTPLDHTAEETRTPTEWAQQLCNRVTESGQTASHVAVLLPTASTLAATIRTDQLPRHNKHQALVYRLEDELPLAAEQLAADFIERDTTALAVAIRSDNLKPWLDALNAVGLHVDLLIPQVLAAAQRILVDQSETDLLILGEDNHVSMLWLSDETITHWTRAQANAAAMTREIHAHALRYPTPIKKLCCSGLAASEVASLEQSLSLTIDVSPAEDAMTCAALAASQMLHDTLTAPANLLTGPLAPTDRWHAVRGPLRFAYSAAAMVMLALSATFIARGYQYHQATGTDLESQKSAYQLAFPGQSPPIGIRSRLESEHHRVLAISGQGLEHYESVSALQTLYEALRRLPTDLRYRLLEIRVNGNRLELEGQVRSHSDAELLVTALRLQSGFEMAPPHTEKLINAGVAFTTLGQRSAAVDPGMASARKGSTP